MLRTGVISDPRYGDHDTGAGHPESAARSAALHRLIEQYRRPDLIIITPRAAAIDDLALAHDQSHIDRVAATAGLNRSAFDSDTPVSARSYDTAKLAAGGVLSLLDAVLAGEIDNGFAAVRPPGHHAERDRAMGFCLFNNVAVGARHLQRSGVGKILIVDWDVHHGNGTQHLFEDDPSVLFVSVHQHPFYPGSGGLSEVGVGEGEGATVNLPLPAGCGDGEYRAVFSSIVAPICRQFDPDFVMVSAGFDGHVRDPLAGMRLTETGFAALAQAILQIAAVHASDRCVAVLEGGYDLQALGVSVLAVLDEMGGAGSRQDPTPVSESAMHMIRRIAEVHRHHWRLPEL